MIADHPLKLGFAMEGMEDRMGGIVRNVCVNFARPTYLEIGIGHGETLVGLSTVFRDSSEHWRCVGIDLPNGYSLNKNACRDNAYRAGIRSELQEGVTGKLMPKWNQITIVLQDAQQVLAEHWQEEISLALIDGCHGKKCATLEFLLLEPFVPKGGIVMFHDFGHDQIGQEQPHCKEGIDVRGACEDLGLLDNKRPGWKYQMEIIGNKQQGSANMGVFQKV